MSAPLTAVIPTAGDGPEAKKKERVDPKELIRQKLVELKRRAREEAEKNASQRKNFLQLQLKPKSAFSAPKETKSDPKKAEDEYVFGWPCKVVIAVKKCCSLPQKCCSLPQPL